MKAIQSLQELPEVREGRVRELRALVATGTYRVNADAVAAGILREIAHLEHTDASES
jgi:flagellar biosynthesis anti-sigma factor FlgM